MESKDYEKGCHNCGSFDKLEWQPSMTAYHYEEGEPDPNTPQWLCKECREHYIEYWTTMWDEYHSSRGV